MAAYECKRDHDWDQAASIIANLGAALTGKQLSPQMFHPYREHRKILDDPGKEYERLMRERKSRPNAEVVQGRAGEDQPSGREGQANVDQQAVGVHSPAGADQDLAEAEENQ